MTLRTHTYTQVLTPSQRTLSLSPSTPSPPRTPPSPPSPLFYPSPSSAEAKHRSQLSSYKRDPTKSAGATRLASIHAAWGGGGTDRASAVAPPAPTPTRPRVRRLSSVEEEGDGEARKKHRSTRVLFNAWTARVRGRLGRYVFWAVAVLVLWVVVVRPLVHLTTDNVGEWLGAELGGELGGVELGTVGGGGATRAAAASRRAAAVTRRSTRTDPAAPPRAPLPPAISKALPAHPVVDGLLRVNSRSTVHPIYQLIHDARAEWDKKVERQSRTLKEAVEEYKRRYKRAPPKGFDKWWAYVCEHNVPLPDEYDQIHTDLLPFRALSPRGLSARILAAAQLPDTYTVAIRHGSLRTKSIYARTIEGADERLEGQAELIRPIAKWLPDLTVVYSVHDTATAVVGWDHKRELLEHVEDDEWFDEDDEIDMTLRGWSSACPPSSPLRAHLATPPTSPLPPTSLPEKSFISSHAATFDLCAHPDLVPIHGALAGKDPAMQPLTPIFSLSKTRLHADVLGVPVEQWVESMREVPWEARKEERLLWRGSNTGAYHDQDTPWRVSHRTRLMTVANMDSQPEVEEAERAEAGEEEGRREKMEMLPAPRNMRAKSLERGVRKVTWGDASSRYMDMAFTGSPIQCDVEDGTCEDLAYEFPWTEAMTHDDALNYKYVIDVDGNAWSARFKRLLASGSMIFKATIMPEWWTDRIQPWVHYVPIRMDYSDLYDALAFFQGDISHTGGEPLLARTIAAEGKRWSDTHWRKEDMTAYVFRLYLEWGRLVAPTRRAGDFVYDESMEVAREGN
ncbi:hypothetical protein IAT38_007949 [Cryptococcus sp. DSM 104549]